MIAYFLDVLDVTAKVIFGLSFLLTVSVLVFWIWREWMRKDKG